MEENEDISSENITFGSTNKGMQITVKGIKSKKKNQDNLSVATNDTDANANEFDETEFRLKSISRYSKQELLDIAHEKGIDVTERSNKTDIYNIIRNSV